MHFLWAVILLMSAVFCTKPLVSSTLLLEDASQEGTPPISLAQEELPMCIICREFYNPANATGMVTLCPAEHDGQESHTFHQACIDMAILKNNECPTCRKDFTVQQLRGAGIGANVLLVRAILANKVSMVAWALEHGASVSTSFSDDCVSPLHIAISFRNMIPCNLNIIELLLKAGADVEAVDGKGLKPLALAVMVNSTAIPLLVQYGANIHATHNGVGYLVLAAHTGSPEAAEALCQYGIDKNAQYRPERSTALHMACAAQGSDPAAQYATARALLHYKDIDAGICGKTGSDSLVLLANGRTAPRDLVGKLLQRGAALEGGPDASFTPLQHAVLHDNYNIVHALLEKGANKDVMTDEGLSLVGLACVAGARNVLEILLKAGIDCSSATCHDGSFTIITREQNYDSYRTPYMLAKERGFDSMAAMVREYEDGSSVAPRRGSRKRRAVTSSSAEDVAASEK